MHTPTSGRFPANLGARTRRAWDAIVAWLSDGQWHTHAELTMEAGLASDLSDKSIDELIRKGYRTRHYTRRTAQVPGTAGRVQGAVYRLVETPASSHPATSSPPRPRPRPHLVPDEPRAPSDDDLVPRPPIFDGDEVTEPSRDDLNNNQPTSSHRRAEVRSCRSCGCTDNTACWPTCWWTQPDLCSACR